MIWSKFDLDLALQRSVYLPPSWPPGGCTSRWRWDIILIEPSSLGTNHLFLHNLRSRENMKQVRPVTFTMAMMYSRFAHIINCLSTSINCESDVDLFIFPSIEFCSMNWLLQILTLSQTWGCQHYMLASTGPLTKANRNSSSSCMWSLCWWKYEEQEIISACFSTN